MIIFYESYKDLFNIKYNYLSSTTVKYDYFKYESIIFVITFVITFVIVHCLKKLPKRPNIFLFFILN